MYVSMSAHTAALDEKFCGHVSVSLSLCLSVCLSGVRGVEQTAGCLYTSTTGTGTGKGNPAKGGTCALHRVSLIAVALFNNLLSTTQTSLQPSKSLPLNPPPPARSPPTPTDHTAPYTPSPTAASNSFAWSSAPPASPASPFCLLSPSQTLHCG